jgi:hypothetical protein
MGAFCNKKFDHNGRRILGNEFDNVLQKTMGRAQLVARWQLWWWVRVFENSGG